MEDVPFGDLSVKLEDDVTSCPSTVESRNPVAPGKKRVPRGTSSYQAAWIVEEVLDEDAEEIDDDNTQMNICSAENIDQEDSAEEFEDIEIENRSVKYDALDDEEEERQ